MMKYYAIKSSFINFWGAESFEFTVIAEDEIEMCACGWEMSVAEVMDMLIECPAVCRISSDSESCIVYWNPVMETVFTEDDPDRMFIDFHGSKKEAGKEILGMCKHFNWTFEKVESEE